MKILAVCPRPDDATAWYRVISPLRILERQAPDVRIQVVSGLGAEAAMIAMANVLFLQRPISDDAVIAATYAKSKGVRVWVDYDDDYTGVPVDNPLFHHFSASRVRENVEKLLELSDLATVSTEALRVRYSKHAKRCVRIPNALDDGMVLSTVVPRLPVRTVLWRGGDSHIEDLAWYGEAMVCASWRFEACWKFLGHSPYRIVQRMPPLTASVFPFIPLEQYWNKLADLRPSIFVVPLKKTPFNEAKSHISLLEALWAGAVPLVPRWAEFMFEGKEIPGVAYYSDDPKDFEEALVTLGHTPLEQLASSAALGLAFVRKKMLVSQTNKIRALGLQTILAAKQDSLELQSEGV